MFFRPIFWSFYFSRYLASLLHDFSLSLADHWDFPSDLPEHSLKIYKSDQSFKYLLVHHDTSARQVGNPPTGQGCQLTPQGGAKTG